MPSLKAALAANLRKYRELRQMSQAQLAAAAGTTRNTVVLYEGEKSGITVDTIAGLARALGVEETDLVQVRAEPKAIEIEHSLKECVRRVSDAILHSDQNRQPVREFKDS